MTSGQIADHGKRFAYMLAHALSYLADDWNKVGWSCWAVAEGLRLKICDDNATDG